MKSPLPSSNQKTVLPVLIFILSVISVFGYECSSSIRGLVGNGNDGSIHSPGFPASYPKQSMRYTCTYHLEIIGEGYITLSFDDFHLNEEVVYTCKNNGTFDYLTINLHDNHGPTYHCGVGRPPAIIAPKSMVTVELVVHPNPSSASFRGFKMSYKFISSKTKMELSSNKNTEDTIIPNYENDQGSFTIPQVRPLVPQYTSQSLHIIWYVTAPEEQQRVQLNIIDFELPSYVVAPMVLVADGPTSQSQALLSGTTMNAGPFCSTQRFMFVQLKGAVAAGISFKAEFSFFTELGNNEVCPRNLRRCQHTKQCILPELFCNGRQNCKQGEDERGCNSLCDPNPCENGGACEASGDLFTCTCPLSFTGRLCTKSTTVTKIRRDGAFGNGARTTVAFPSCSGACFNGGQCVNGECQCPSNYIGPKCEYPSNNTVPDLENTSIMIGAFVGAVCLLSICWLVAMARKRYTEQEEQQQPGNRPPQRMISVHSPEELGLSRSITNGPGDMEIPPDYSEVFLDSDKPAATIIPISEPMSPPPSYDIVTTSDDDGGIFIECPHRSNGNLPDIVDNEGGLPAPGSPSPAAESSTPPARSSSPSAVLATENDVVSRQSSRSTDV